MIFYIVEFLASFIESLVFMFILTKVFESKYCKSKTIILSFILAMLLTSIALFLNTLSLYSIFTMIILSVLLGFCSMLIYKFNNFLEFAIATLYFVFLGALDFLVLSIIEIWGEKIGFTLSIITTFSTKRIVYICFMKLLLILFSLCFHFVFKKRERKLKITKTLSLIIIAFNLMCFIVINYLVSAIIGNDVINLKKSVMISWVALVTVVALIITVIQLVFNNKQQKHQNEMIKLQQQFVKQEYEQLSQEYQNKSKYYHDFKNHILSMKTMLQHEQYDASKEYINKLHDEVCNVSYQVFTGSKLVDAVLNNETQRAKENNIKLTINSEYNIIKQELAFDVCIILSNLIDNAIEASVKEKQELRNVEVNISTKKEMLLLEVKNYVSQSPFNEKGELVTNKKDKSFHGIGLKSVQMSVENNNGILEQKYENKTFRSIVLI